MIESLVLNAAYVALLGSGFTRTLIRLRALLVLGSIAFVIYGLLADILSMVIWNVVIGLIHVTRIIRERRTQHSVVLTADECVIRDQMFPGLSDFDFNFLWQMGEFAEFVEGEVIIARGTQPEHVGLLLEGVVSIPGIVELAPGAVYGEMSFISGEPANADVVAQGRVEVHRWEQRELRTLDQLHPPSGRAFQQMLSHDLVTKIKG